MVDPSEVSGAVNAAIEQIVNALAGTNLYLRETNLEIEDYYTVKTELANSGYSNSVDIQGLIIDPTVPTQAFAVPVNRRFSNNEVYMIGVLTITIADSLEDPTPAPKTDEKSEAAKIRDLILTILVALLLLTVMIFAVVLLVKLMKKRTSDKNHRNPTIL